MQFGTIRRTGPGMRQVAGRGTFGGEFGVCHFNQWGLYGVGVQQHCDAALFPNYFGRLVTIPSRIDQSRWWRQERFQSELLL